MTDEEHLDSFAPFTPVPVRRRHDGWFPERQRAFIRHLIVYGSIERAAEMVGMSKTSAHRLRRRGDAESFSRAWDAALGLNADYRAALRRQAYRSRIRKRAPSMTRQITNIDKINTRHYYESKGYSGKFRPKFTPARHGD